MFFKRDVLPLDKPIKKKGSELLPRLKEQLLIVEDEMKELDNKISELSKVGREDGQTVERKRQLIRSQADQVIQKEWLTQLIDIVDEKKSYLLTIGEAKTLGLLSKK